jgi:hypothetical protein
LQYTLIDKKCEVFQKCKICKKETLVEALALAWEKYLNFTEVHFKPLNGITLRQDGIKHMMATTKVFYWYSLKVTLTIQKGD